MVSRTHYSSLVARSAAQAGIDPNLLEALVLVESGGLADAFRFEPKFAERYRIATHPIYKQWPVRAVASSYGLTQIMATTAYEAHSFRGEPEELFLPATNLRLGAAHLRLCLDWAASKGRGIDVGLCAYNAGRSSAVLLPRPRNIAYALRILELAKQL